MKYDYIFKSYYDILNIYIDYRLYNFFLNRIDIKEFTAMKQINCGDSIFGSCRI